MATDRFMLAYFTESHPAPSGMPEWFQHMTIMPWILGDVAAIENTLTDIALQQAPIGITVNGDDYFGPNKDVHVKRVDYNPALYSLHQMLKRGIEVRGGVLEDDLYAGENYKPHISLKAGQPDLADGTRFIVDKISIVQKLADQRILRSHISLG